MLKSKTIIQLLGLFVLIFIFVAPFFFDQPSTYIYLDGIGAVPPGTKGHLLGTDTIGRDVFVGLVSGARFSILFSLISLSVSLILGILFGFFTSYIGDFKIQVTVLQCILFMIAFPFIIYYAFQAFAFHFVWKVLVFGIGFACLLYIMHKIRFIGKKFFYVPMDTIGVKIYEFYRSIYVLIVFLIFIGLSPKNNFWFMALLFGVLMWPLFYRYIRLEILSEKGKDRFVSLKNLGYTDMRIIFSDFLPHMLPVLSTPFVFAFVSIIFVEANLSFLGMGIGDQVTWGALLAEAKRDTSAWWLVVFPGCCLFILFYILDRLFGSEERDFIR